MTADLKHTLTADVTPDSSPKEESDLAVRTTLVQPMPHLRDPDFTRTRYWEKPASDVEEPRRSAANCGSTGKTSVGFGPDDPIVQAVRAAKLQLLEHRTH